MVRRKGDEKVAATKWLGKYVMEKVLVATWLVTMWLGKVMKKFLELCG